jgi:hypothetical protein
LCFWGQNKKCVIYSLKDFEQVKDIEVYGSIRCIQRIYNLLFIGGEGFISVYDD